MIRALTAPFEQLNIAIQMARAAEQDALQVVFGRGAWFAGGDQYGFCLLSIFALSGSMSIKSSWAARPRWDPRAAAFSNAVSNAS